LVAFLEVEQKLGPERRALRLHELRANVGLVVQEHAGERPPFRRRRRARRRRWRRRDAEGLTVRDSGDHGLEDLDVFRQHARRADLLGRLRRELRFRAGDQQQQTEDGGAAAHFAAA
jgi:hypothetical protein